jgi:hypothetical protein
LHAAMLPMNAVRLRQASSVLRAQAARAELLRRRVERSPQRIETIDG